MPKAKGKVIEGRLVRVFLFARKSPLSGARPVMWQVEGFTKDDALSRLCEVEHWVERSAWEFIDELDPEHDIGALGRKLHMGENGTPRLTTIAGIVRPVFRKLH